MAMIKTIEVFQKYVNVTGTLKYASIEPFMNDAEQRYLREFLGETLLDELNAFAADSDDLPTWYGYHGDIAENLTKLLPYVQCALAKFTLFIASPFIDLKVTDGGFAITQNTNLAPASSDRVKRFTDATLKAGYDNVETLLRYLEKYKDLYPSWVDGDGYTIHTKYFINSAEEFNKHADIDNSRLRFRSMVNTMENVELLMIEPVISTALAETIKGEIIAGSVSENNLKILLYIRKAIANLTMYEFGIATENLPNNNAVFNIELSKLENSQRMGNYYLAEVKKVLDANPDNYPSYKESSVFDVDKTSNDLYENNADLSTFVFGG